MLAPAPASIGTLPCTGSTLSRGCCEVGAVGPWLAGARSAKAAATASAGTPLARRRLVTVPITRPSVDRRGQQIQPPFGRALVDRDREEAADGIGVHHRHHVHRALLAEQLGDLGKGGRLHL